MRILLWFNCKYCFDTGTSCNNMREEITNFSKSKRERIQTILTEFLDCLT